MKRSELTVGMYVEDKYGRKFVVVDTEGWIAGDGQRRPIGKYIGDRSVGSHAVTARAFRSDFDSPARGVLVVSQSQLDDSAGRVTVDAEVMALRSLFPVGTYAAARAKNEAEQAELEAAVAKGREQLAREDAALLDSARAHWGHDTAHLLFAMNGVSSQPKDGIWSPEDRRVVTAIVLCGQRR